ncbi:TPA: chromate transporter [Bacillus cereus]|nr:chromate transporter [Bacillus cereus]
MLPLLEREFVPTDWMDEASFLAGYGATQAVPGPLFTFTACILVLLLVDGKVDYWQL